MSGRVGMSGLAPRAIALLATFAISHAEAQESAPAKLGAAIDARNAALDALRETIAPSRRDHRAPKAASAASAVERAQAKPAAHAVSDPMPRPGAITITPSGFFAVESASRQGR